MSPVFSVIVPTFSRPANLQKCVRALSRQTFAGPFEVIVVNDGGGAVPNISVVNEASFRICVLYQVNSGPAAARNLGASRAKGEFLAFTDDDCEPSPDWLEELSRKLASDPRAMLGGRTVNALPENSCSAASQLLIDFLYAFYLEDGLPKFFTSNNLAVARAAFKEVGGFDETFPLPAAEDREFCLRWRRTGKRMVYAPGALIRHSHNLTLAGFFAQHFRYGRGAWHFRGARARSGDDRIRLESLTFYMNLLCYPLRSGRGGAARRWKQLVLFLISQIANAVGFFSERWWPNRPHEWEIRACPAAAAELRSEQWSMSDTFREDDSS